MVTYLPDLFLITIVIGVAIINIIVQWFESMFSQEIKLLPDYSHARL